MNTWLNNYNKEELLSIIQIVRKNYRYRRMKNSTILKKLINNEITKEQVASLRVLRFFVKDNHNMHIDITILKR